MNIQNCDIRFSRDGSLNDITAELSNDSIEVKGKGIRKETESNQRRPLALQNGG